MLLRQTITFILFLLLLGVHESISQSRLRAEQPENCPHRTVPLRLVHGVAQGKSAQKAPQSIHQRPVDDRLGCERCLHVWSWYSNGRGRSIDCFMTKALLFEPVWRMHPTTSVRVGRSQLRDGGAT
jgi:hypothetical protein